MASIYLHRNFRSKAIPRHDRKHCGDGPRLSAWGLGTPS
jgi:hypothetical protein